MAVGGEDGSIAIVYCSEMALLLTIQTSDAPVQLVRWSSCGARLLAVHEDGTLELHDSTAAMRNRLRPVMDERREGLPGRFGPAIRAEQR